MHKNGNSCLPVFLNYFPCSTLAFFLLVWSISHCKGINVNLKILIAGNEGMCKTHESRLGKLS